MTMEETEVVIMEVMDKTKGMGMTSMGIMINETIKDSSLFHSKMSIGEMVQAMDNMEVKAVDSICHHSRIMGPILACRKPLTIVSIP